MEKDNKHDQNTTIISLNLLLALYDAMIDFLVHVKFRIYFVIICDVPVNLFKLKPKTCSYFIPAVLVF